MHKRSSVIGTGILILVLVLAMLPLTHLLDEDRNEIEWAEQEMIASTLANQRVHSRLSWGCEAESAMDIEDIWAIEDARCEAETPLVFGMHNGIGELGYDEEDRTFYCTLGMDCGDDWPEIRLFAQHDEAKDVQIAWIDDYTYDYPSDAIRDGYRYELLAYTDTEFEYVGVVFTGMPIVTLHTFSEGELGEAYAPARVSVAGAGYEPIDSAALAHVRGGGYYKGIDKFSYRIEFHDEMANGRAKKKARSVLGMEADTDWLLLSNAQEESALRNHLAFDLWKRWNEGKRAPMMLDSCLVELFVDDEYKGIYQLMQRVDAEKEILRMGGDLNTDSMVRLISLGNMNRKPTRVWEDAGFFVEYRYGLDGNAQAAFDRFEHYAMLSDRGEDRLDDDAFAAIAQECLDVDSLLNYYLFMQACGLADNVLNNLFIWIMEEDGRIVYRFSPWDMDNSLPEMGYRMDGSGVCYYEERMIAVQRLLDLNLMNSRERLWTIWREKWDTVLGEAELWDWIIGMQEYVNASGADLREFDKWRGGAYRISLTPMYDSVVERLYAVEETLAERWPFEE